MTVDKLIKERLEGQLAIPNILMAYMYKEGITELHLDEGDWRLLCVPPTT